MNGTSSSLTDFLQRGRSIERHLARSTTHGPALRNKGFVEADFEAAKLMLSTAIAVLSCRPGTAERPRGNAARADGAAGRRAVNPDGTGSHEQGCVGSSIISHRLSLSQAGNAQALSFSRVLSGVDFVAVRWRSLIRTSASDRPCAARLPTERGALGAQAHRVPPRSDFFDRGAPRAVAVLPFGHERDHRVRVSRSNPCCSRPRARTLARELDHRELACPGRCRVRDPCSSRALPGWPSSCLPRRASETTRNEYRVHAFQERADAVLSIVSESTYGC